MVRPRILIYRRRRALSRVVLEREPRAREEASLRFVTAGAVGLMERAVMGGEQVGELCGVLRGWWGGRGGMRSRHTLSRTRLEPTRTGVGSPGRKDGECSGGEDAGARGLEEGGDGEERVRE